MDIYYQLTRYLSIYCIMLQVCLHWLLQGEGSLRRVMFLNRQALLENAKMNHIRKVNTVYSVYDIKHPWVKFGTDKISKSRNCVRSWNFLSFNWKCIKWLKYKVYFCLFFKIWESHVESARKDTRGSIISC